MNSTVKTVMFLIFILVCLMLLLSVWQKSLGVGKDTEYKYSELSTRCRMGRCWMRRSRVTSCTAT